MADRPVDVPADLLAEVTAEKEVAHWAQALEQAGTPMTPAEQAKWRRVLELGLVAWAEEQAASNG